MAETLRTELLFVRRDIRKYLHLNLDPDRGLMLPNSKRLQGEIAVLVTRHMVQVQLDTGTEARAGRMPLLARFDMQAVLELQPEMHNAIIAFAERCYYEEFHAMCDSLHLFTKVPLIRAVESFRDLYAICEDDYPLAASLKNYRRHLNRMGRHGRRGRKQLPYELLRDPRPRDLTPTRPRLGPGEQATLPLPLPKGPAQQGDLFSQ